jgi:phosphate transport system protein
MPHRHSRLREAFTTALLALEDDVHRLGRAAGEAIHRAVDAFRRRDVADAEAVVAGDSRIDAMRLTIEQRAVELLATQQPVAGDLRWLASVLVIATDLERLADHGEAIARAARRVPATLPATVALLGQMEALVQGMLDQTLDAWRRRDAERALTVVPLEETVDALRAQVFQELIAQPGAPPLAMDLVLEHLIVAQHLERAADHITNVAERVIYIATGELRELNP